MPQKKSKKILKYFFLFLIIGTINNKNLSTNNFTKVDEILVFGLDEKNNNEIVNNIKSLKLNNLFFLEKDKIKKIVSSNQLVENYSVFRQYPSSLKINIKKTEFLAQVVKNNDIFLLGSNGNLIKTKKFNKDIPTIIGNFNNENLLNLKKAANDSSFDFFSIKKLFFYDSGRWDLELNSGILVKLPRNNILESLKFLILILAEKQEKKIDIIDLRQKNQIILNG